MTTDFRYTLYVYAREAGGRNSHFVMCLMITILPVSNYTIVNRLRISVELWCLSIYHVSSPPHLFSEERVESGECDKENWQFAAVVIRVISFGINGLTSIARGYIHFLYWMIIWFHSRIRMCVHSQSITKVNIFTLSEAGIPCYQPWMYSTTNDLIKFLSI